MSGEPECSRIGSADAAWPSMTVRSGRASARRGLAAGRMWTRSRPSACWRHSVIVTCFAARVACALSPTTTIAPGSLVACITGSQQPAKRRSWSTRRSRPRTGPCSRPSSLAGCGPFTSCATRGALRSPGASMCGDRTPRAATSRCRGLSATGVAARWIVHNGMMEVLARRIPVARLRYEALLEQPAAELSRVPRGDRAGR